MAKVMWQKTAEVNGELSLYEAVLPYLIGRVVWGTHVVMGGIGAFYDYGSARRFSENVFGIGGPVVGIPLREFGRYERYPRSCLPVPIPGYEGTAFEFPSDPREMVREILIALGYQIVE